LYHDQPTVAGTSSVLPAQMLFLNNWLSQRPHPFSNPNFVQMLRYYQVRFILLHMRSTGEWAALEEAKQAREVGNTQCFSPPAGPSPWPYPICVIEVMPSATPYSNVKFQNGWADKEDWGIWATSTQSQASWVAASRVEYRLSVDSIPMCVPAQSQRITLEVNGVEVGTHQWDSCDHWSDNMMIPERLIRIGWNDLVIRTAYAARPIDITHGQNGDTRQLSVGFARLSVEPIGAGEVTNALSGPIQPDQYMPPLRTASVP
jgi:hypothetical protein